MMFQCFLIYNIDFDVDIGQVCCKDLEVIVDCVVVQYFDY